MEAIKSYRDSLGAGVSLGECKNRVDLYEMEMGAVSEKEQVSERCKQLSEHLLKLAENTPDSLTLRQLQAIEVLLGA